MSFWNQQFSSKDFKYGKQPNSFLRDQAFRLRPGGKVLLPGDGEGRNSVWLAQQGYQVTAMDISSVGLKKALELAAEKGVQIDVVQADLEHWTPAPASFDALVLTYVHLPPGMRAQAHRRLLQALRPGGWLILEAFHPLQLGYNSGGPKDEAMLYAADMLRSDLTTTPCLEQVIAWEGEALLDEGSGHQGPAYLTRYVAQRASSPLPASA